MGRLTASHAETVAVAAKGLETYVYGLMADKHSAGTTDAYTSEAMQHGIDTESDARAIYELETGNAVKEIGFIEVGEHVGCSPDGLVGDDGLLEIKCPKEAEHLRTFITENIQSKYVWQMQMQMLLTERKWCDFVSFNPNLKQSLVVLRIEADEQAHNKLRAGIEKGIELIKEIESKI